MVASHSNTFATDRLRASTFGARGPVGREVTIAAPIDAVWRALTDPTDLAVWFGAEVAIDVRRGGSVRIRFPDGTERRGIVVELDAPHRLAFRWRTVRTGRPPTADATVVAFELRPDGDATRVVVTESPGVLGPESSAPEATS
jgi:uncharacterized protein YndB with AHSA1/START domain